MDPSLAVELGIGHGPRVSTDNAPIQDPVAWEGARDKGLVRGMGLFAFTFALLNAVIGGGIFSLPAAMAHAAGGQALTAYFVCALAMGAVVLCCAEAGSRVPTSGGMYGWVEAAFGPLAGFIGGVLLWLGCVLAAGGIAAALGESLAKLVPGVPALWTRDAVVVLVLSGVALLNSTSVKAASRVIGWATALKLLPLLLFLGVGFAHVEPGEAAPAGGAVDPSSLGHAALLALFAFQGMETPLSASGEVAKPARNLPLALFLSMGAVTIFYISIQAISQGLLGADLATSTSPLSDALGRIDPRLGALMLAAAAISRTVWLSSDALGAPRILFAFARDGFLPSAIGKVSERGHAPVNAIWTHVSIAIALGLFADFERLAVLSALADVALYAMVCAAVWRLRQRNVAVAGAPFRLPALGLWVVLGIGAMLAAIALDYNNPNEIWALVGAIVGSAVLYGVIRLFRRKPA
jgi:amino acid transporter